MEHVQIQQLKRIRLFSRLPDATSARLAAMARTQQWTAGDVLLEEGSPVTWFHSLLEGSGVLISGTSGHESVLEFVGSGDSILLPSVLLGLPSPVSARMSTAGRTLTLPAQAFLQLVARDAALARECAQAVAQHWSVLLSQVRQIKTQGAAERLAHFLLSQVSATMGPAALTLPGMKKQVATRLGIKPETLSRSLRKLRAFGVEATGDMIRIRSVERLQTVLGHEGSSRAHALQPNDVP
jgi:CRP-like cAMP-binding protein